MRFSKILHITLFLFISNISQAQSISKSVIGSSGTTNTDSNNSVTWTVGEPVVGTMTNNGFQIGSGYHLSLDVQALSTEDFDIESIIIFPNPTSQSVTVKHSEEHRLKIDILGINGNLIKEFKENECKNLDVSFLTNGIYILKVQDINSGKQNNYKIIKR